MVNILSDSNSVINNYLYEIRNVEIQQDRLRFRKNAERLGELMAYEISKTLTYCEKDVETPLGVAKCSVPEDEVVIGTILRAGLPFHYGMLNIFDHAGNAFFSAYRKHHKDGTFEIKLDYVTSPEMEGKVLILADPMLATGASIVKVLKAIDAYGKPKAIHFASIISSRYGVEYLQRNFPNVHIWTVAMDEELTAKSYIVPGLGDAGDLMYGPKIQE